MGVPAFFRWLSRKYVSIIVDAVEERRREINDVKVPVDATKPNANFQEFDNLYLDMNGIIHPCTHPEDRPAPKTEDEMFILIFEYIDRLFSIVRPRKVLYMAIDGVAPRAKMNQQRSRRFRAAKEAADKREQIATIRKKLEAEGIPLPPPRKAEEHFDSNCITPGTPFMARLATALRYYIHKRITYDPAWQKIQVILSDANVPGEGEHKIMDYIRRQRASPSHDPNTVHCLCGADADLIMLGLATHEANFNIIREEFVPNQPRPCELCGQYGHEVEHCEGLARAEAGPDQADPLKKEKNFIFIRLPVLREYLERELVMPNLPFPFDLERAIDDWVMMCFFVGNDFLPHLPSLEIRENAIDRLVKLYRDMVYQTGGWLTQDGEVNIERVKIIMIKLGEVEDEIFKHRQIKELQFKNRQKQTKRREKEERTNNIMPYNARLIAPTAPWHQRHISGEEMRKLAAVDRMEFAKMANVTDSSKLRSLLTPVDPDQRKRKMDADTSGSPNGAPLPKDGSGSKQSGSVTDQADEVSPKPMIKVETPSGKSTPLAKGAMEALNEGSDEEEEPADEIRLWEAGWKDRYYRAKFNVSESDIELRKKVACAYVEGLSWVLRYYYQGCASWTWFFPYHYAPFASDFELIGDFQPDFSKPTRPFRPLEQLMGVFPAASRAHIPESWGWLMTDAKSPIIDFYPEDFEIDLNGKKYAWQGVALLPFVDEKRLLSALDTVYNTLTPDEEARNKTGPDRLFIGNKHNLFELVHEVHAQGKLRKDSSSSSAEEKKNTDGGEEEVAKNGENEVKEQQEEASNESKDSNGLVSEIFGGKTWIHIDASKAFGMAGEVSHDVHALTIGESHKTMFKNSIEFSDIKNNTCIMLEFRDPQFAGDYRFKANRLDGINELSRVLKSKDWDDRRGGPFRPQIGFSRDIPRASLSSAGHRTLNHQMHENRRSGPPNLFSAAAPYHYHNHHPPPANPLPWHVGGAPHQAQQSPFPLFSQMALPPPLPPADWISRAQQSYNAIQYGQPPPSLFAGMRQPPTAERDSWRRSDGGGDQYHRQRDGSKR